MLIKLETKAQLYSVFSNDEHMYQKKNKKLLYHFITAPDSGKVSD